MIVKTGNKEDLRDLSELWVKMIKEIYPEWQPDVLTWIERNKILCDNDNYHISYVKEAHKIVGFMDGVVFYEPAIGKNVALAQHLYIKPDFRNTRAAYLLCIHMKRIAKDAHAEVIEINAMPYVVQAYLKMGFKKEQTVMRRFL